MQPIKISDIDVPTKEGIKTAKQLSINSVTINYSLIAEKDGGVDADNAPILAHEPVFTDNIIVLADNIEPELIEAVKAFTITRLQVTPTE